MNSRDEHFSFQGRKREQITPFKSVMERESQYVAFPSPAPVSVTTDPRSLYYGDIPGQASRSLIGGGEGFSQTKMKLSQVFQQPKSSLQNPAHRYSVFH